MFYVIKVYSFKVYSFNSFNAYRYCAKYLLSVNLSYIDRNILVCLFSAHRKLNLSRYELIGLTRLRFEKYISHHRVVNNGYATYIYLQSQLYSLISRITQLFRAQFHTFCHIVSV